MRYIIADEPDMLWGHIFSGSRETATRFVFDTEENRMIAAQLRDGATGSWSDADPAELSDLEDSLVNANSEAIADPQDWGLIDADEAPAWSIGNTPGLAA